MKVYVIKNTSTGKYYQTNKYYTWGDFIGARTWTKRNLVRWMKSYKFKTDSDVIIEELTVGVKENPEKSDVRKEYPFQIFLV
jgi:hypothetical protein